MKYAGWNAEHEDSQHYKKWKYEDADINVVLTENPYSDGWRVMVLGTDTVPVLTGQFTKGEIDEIDCSFDTQAKAKVFAHGLLDGIHSVYSMQHKEPLQSGAETYTSAKEYFQNAMHVDVDVSDRDKISKGYFTGVIVLGPEKDAFNQLAYEEYVRMGIEYYMTDHTIEPEVSFRYNVVDYSNNFDDYESVSSRRSDAGLEPVEDL